MTLQDALFGVKNFKKLYKTSDENIEKIKEIEFLRKKYGLTYKEAVLFSFIVRYFFWKNSFNDIHVENLIDELGIELGTKEHIDFLKLLRSLSDKELIVIKKWLSDYDNKYIKIDKEILDELLGGHKVKIGEIDFNDIYETIDYIDDLFLKKKDNFITLNKLEKILMEVSRKSKFFNFLTKYESIEVLIFYRVLIRRIYGTYSNDILEVAYFEKASRTFGIIEKIYNNEFKIIKDGILEINKNEKHIEKSKVSLSQNFYYKLFNVKKERIKFNSKVMKHVPYEDIKQEIFLEKKVKKNIELIEKAIDIKNFKRVTEELSEHSLSKGITILLHGCSGTGKTATAYYLAKVSKRDVLQVNISNIRGRYVGQNEKRMKKIFEEYERAKKELGYEPILLFNEADALIAKRMESRGSAELGDNAMQNILLEELEKFNGILIATTNLIENLDKAFDRRFLYKIEYEKPSFEIRKKIFASKLKVDFVDELAKYELTGGQIENVSKKALLENIVNQKEITLNEMEKLIEEELSFKNGNNRIGLLKT